MITLSSICSFIFSNRFIPVRLLVDLEPNLAWEYWFHTRNDIHPREKLITADLPSDYLTDRWRKPKNLVETKTDIILQLRLKPGSGGFTVSSSDIITSFHFWHLHK